MKKYTNYQTAKRSLKSTSEMAKSQYSTDKPAIRMIINDSVDFLSKELNLSEYERDLLSNYAVKLHPKN